MGWEENATMNIRDKDLYERMKKCIYRRTKTEKTESINPWNWFIDLARFAGIRETLEHTADDVELNNEEKDYINGLFNCGRSYRSVLCYLFDWNEDAKCAMIMVTGWKWYPNGLLEYISKMYPEEHFEVTETWDSDVDIDQDDCQERLLINGEWFDDEDDYNKKRRKIC